MFYVFYSQFRYLGNVEYSSRATLRCLAGRMWLAGRTLPVLTSPTLSLMTMLRQPTISSFAVFFLNQGVVNHLCVAFVMVKYYF